MSAGRTRRVDPLPEYAFNGEAQYLKVNSNGVFDVQTPAEATQLLEFHYKECYSQSAKIRNHIKEKNVATLKELKGMSISAGAGGELVLNMITEHLASLVIKVDTYAVQEVTRTNAVCKTVHGVYNNQNNALKLALAATKQNVKAAVQGAFLTGGGLRTADGRPLGEPDLLQDVRLGDMNNLNNAYGLEDVFHGPSQRERAAADAAKGRQDGQARLTKDVEEQAEQQVRRPKQLLMAEVGGKEFVIAYPTKATKTEVVQHWVLNCLVCNRVFDNPQS